MFCGKCGAKLNDGAQFCANCGQKVENVVQGTGMNTSPHMYYGQPVNSGNYNQKKPKKKHTTLIAVAIVLACILPLIGVAFINVMLYGGRASNAGVEDPHFDDVVQSIQGDWYIWGHNTWWHFSIEGTSYELYTQDLSTMATTQVQGRIEPVEISIVGVDDDNYAYLSGELKFVDSSSAEKIIQYSYPHLVSGSTELKWDGVRLERNDVYGRIKDLIQGQWLETDNAGNNCTLKIEDAEFGLLVNLDAVYSGKVEIRPDDRILLHFSDDDTVLTIHYKYDEDTDSIVLTDGEYVLRKSDFPW